MDHLIEPTNTTTTTESSKTVNDLIAESSPSDETKKQCVSAVITDKGRPTISQTLNDHVFKKPETSKLLKSDPKPTVTQNQAPKTVDDAQNTTTRENVPTGSNDGYDNLKEVKDPQNFRIIVSGEKEGLHSIEKSKFKKVQLEVEDTMPCFYDIKSDCTSKPLVAGRLVEAYESIFSKYFVNPKDHNEETDLKTLQHKKIKEIVDTTMSDEHFEKLKNFCSPENLKIGLEPIMKDKFPVCSYSSINQAKNYFSSTGNEEQADNLQTVRKNKLRTNRDFTNYYTKRLKYRGLRFMPFGEGTIERRSSNASYLVPGKDLLFRIRIYRPFPYSPRERKRSGNRHPIFFTDMLLTGRNTLEELRDKISCGNDDGLRIDVSDRKDTEPMSSCKELFPSGFLYINGTFYNDRRAGCYDYSAPIREWAKRREIGEFEAKDLHNVRLDQLTIKFGSPEVYLHQGNCEHLFTFSEVRLVGHQDPLDPSSYPYSSVMSRNHTIYCTTCAEFSAKWVVTECPRVPFDPAFFCESCLNLYLYNDGKKIGHFKAFPYSNE